MELETVIGLEIHVQLKTRSKMFCSCANVFSDGLPRTPRGAGVPPNSAICPICLGYPGTLPQPNHTAIAWVQKAGVALGCELKAASKFDRKSYFYPDLPKGYQISQYDQPFCGQGNVDITVGDTVRRIGITRIHLEEDAAKNTHPTGANYTLVDFNRAGTPLIEIVTEPDFRSPQEAKIFLQELQRIMRHLDISDADMEKGQLRCDANISLREAGTTVLHPKTEIKNLNSFRFVERALAYEIERQTKEWEAGTPPQQSATRGFKVKTGTTVAQRTKEEAADYRYFPEPDIPPFSFTAIELGAIRQSVKELPSAARARFVRDFGINQQQARELLDQPQLASFFENTVSELDALNHHDLVPAAANLILRHLRQLHDALPPETPLAVSAENFAELVVLSMEGKVAKNDVSKALAEMQRTGGDPDAIITNLGLEQVRGEAEIEQYVEEVIAQNPDVVVKVKAGKESALQYLVGQVMRVSKGKANPDVSLALLRQKLL